MSFWDTLPFWAKVMLGVAFVVYIIGAIVPGFILLGCYDDLATFCR
jgi:hypothetical protein